MLGSLQIVVQDHVPVKWLFTSTKTGELMKKRSVDNKAFISEAFTHTALADPTNSDEFVAVVWPKAPSVPSVPGRLLTKEDFDDFMKTLAGNLGDICAFQVRMACSRAGGVCANARQEIELPGLSRPSWLLLVPCWQCYVHPRGGDGTVYVNEYSVTEDTSRVLTSTHKHLRQLSRNPASLVRVACPWP